MSQPTRSDYGQDDAILVVEGRDARVRLTLHAAGFDEPTAVVDVTTLVSAWRETRESGGFQIGGRHAGFALAELLQGTDLWQPLQKGLAGCPYSGWKRLTVEIEEGCKAGDLPWEALGFDVDREERQPFLAGNCELVRSHGGDGRPDLSRARDDDLFRLLVLVGETEQDCEDRDRVAEADVRGILDDTLEVLRGYALGVSMEVVAPGWGGIGRSDVRTVDDVRAWIRGKRDGAGVFDAMLFIGHSHGSVQEGLRFRRPPSASDSEDRSTLSLDDLKEDLDHQRTRLLVLHACALDSASTTSLVGAIDHVVGWAGRATTEACREFNRAFFAAFASVGQPSIPKAMNTARGALGKFPAVRPLLQHHARSTGSRGFAASQEAAYSKFRSAYKKQLLRLPNALRTHVNGAQALPRLYVDLLVTERSSSPVEMSWDARSKPLRNWVRDPGRVRHFCLLGDPGSGKSTVMRQLAADLLDDGWVAVYLPVSALLAGADWRSNLLELCQQGGAYGPSVFLTEERLAREKQTGRLALLLDGWDEVAGEQRDAAETLVQTLVTDVGSGHVVVASRIVGFQPFDDDQFARLEIRELDRPLQEKLFENWFSILADQPKRRDDWPHLRDRGTDTLLEQARAALSRPSLQRACRNPLALTLTALTAAREGFTEIPTRHHEILRTFTDHLLGGGHRGEGPFGVPNRGQPSKLVQDARRLLGHLAIQMLRLRETDVRLVDGANAWSTRGQSFVASLPDDLQQDKLLGPESGARCCPVNDPASWYWSLGSDSPPMPGQRSIAERLRDTGLFAPSEYADDLTGRFSIQSLADFLAAEALVETHDIVADAVAGVDRLLVEVKEAMASAVRSSRDGWLVRWSETLALVTSWLIDPAARKHWLSGLVDIDPALGLRALMLGEPPDSSTIAEVVQAAAGGDKLKFWDGFGGFVNAEREPYARRALNLLEGVAMGLSDGTDRFFVEEEARTLAGGHPVLAREARAVIEVARRGCRFPDKLTESFCSVPEKELRRLDEHGNVTNRLYPLWRRIDPVEGSSDPFWMMACPVTIGMYLGFDPRHQQGWQGRRHDAHVLPPELPVTCVRWWGAVMFTRWLNGWLRDHLNQLGITALEGVGADGLRFRLPTESEWEHACRAGSGTAFWHGPELEEWHNVAWFGEGIDGDVHPVAQKRENPFGLFDVHGNCWEWTADAWKAVSAPKFLEGGRGADRVLRGGSYWDDAVCCTAAFREPLRPGSVYHSVGFRVVFAPPLPGGIEDRT